MTSATRIVESRSRLFAVDSFAVAAEDMSRREAREHLRRREAKERVDAELLAAGAEVADRAERVAAEEHPLLRPPERHLAPDPVAGDRRRVERRTRNALERHDVVRHAEPRREGGAVAPVPVEELDHSGRLAQGPNPLVHSGRVDGIDEPDAALRVHRVRAARQPLLPDPAEAPLGLVAEARGHELADAGGRQHLAAREDDAVLAASLDEAALELLRVEPRVEAAAP